jgi:hypothetical protein
VNPLPFLPPAYLLIYAVVAVIMAAVKFGKGRREKDRPVRRLLEYVGANFFLGFAAYLVFASGVFPIPVSVRRLVLDGWLGLSLVLTAIALPYGCWLAGRWLVAKKRAQKVARSGEAQTDKAVTETPEARAERQWQATEETPEVARVRQGR